MAQRLRDFEEAARASLRGGVLPERRIALCVLLCGAFYGALMGTFGGFGGNWSGAQMLFSAVKVPALLLITFALCLPAFFVLNALLGLGEDFREARRALLSSQAVLALVLASLAPFTLLFYASSSHYGGAILWNALMFALASLVAQKALRRLYAPLIFRNARHLILLRGWLTIFAFTAVQLAYVMRPFVGDPAKPAALFRDGAWDNAYLAIARIVWKMLGG